MNWKNQSAENPGNSVYYADDEEHPGHRYVAIQKRGGTGQWRLAHRYKDDEPLRIIYVGNTLKECKAYADEYRQLIN